MKVLIVGLGSIARKHISAMKELDPNVKLFAFRSSRSSTKIENVLDIYQPEELTRLKVDFVIISNPTYKHKETIESLLYLNVPLFIEKPLFDGLKAESLLRRIDEQKIITYVACNLRYLECLKFVKGMVGQKRINEVNIYCGSYLPDWRPGQDFRKVYSSNVEMAGGVHFDLIHEIDYAFWIFGEPKKVTCSTSSLSSLKISSIDYANYLLEFDKFSISIILNYFRRDSKRTFEVVCEDGTLNADLLNNEVSWNDEIIFRSKQVIKDTYIDQMRFFTNDILSRKNSFNTVNEAYKILKICLAGD
jgi:predicted dehydrogenase